MRLLLSLVLVLVLVIGVSFYKNKEYFTSFSTKPMIGNTVTCTKDVPNGKGPGALYQYTSDTVLDWYPDVDSALVFDRNSRTPKNIADCSTFTLGKRLGPAPTTPDTRIGGASGINKSYGGMNTPDAQLGTPGAVVYNPRTKMPYNAPASALIAGTASQQQLSQASTLSPAATPTRQDVMPQVDVSDTSYTAMDLQNKSSLLKDIQQIVRQEIITSRTQPANHPMAMQQGSNTSTSNATCQGNEYQHNRQDMSKYIKKDAIPCWGCTLDY